MFDVEDRKRDNTKREPLFLVRYFYLNINDGKKCFANFASSPYVWNIEVEGKIKISIERSLAELQIKQCR